jgi:hypothetical protein
VAVRSCNHYFRFVAPVLAELEQEMEIVLIAPDAESAVSPARNHPYTFYRPVERMTLSTRLLRAFRGTVGYLYWALTGALSPESLERVGKKFLKAKVLRRAYSFAVGRFEWLGWSKWLASRLLKAFRWVENAAVDKGIMAQVDAIKPDVLLATPALYPRSWEIDYMKAGLRLAIPTATLIASWDHLSGKGVLSVVADRLLVWNQKQTQEAEEYHAFPANRIAVVGSPTFDWIFDGRFLQPRVDFCRRAKLDAERPFILWAASAPGNCLNEPGVLCTLINAMHGYPILENYQVLIRPHPSERATKWEEWQMPHAPVWSGSAFPSSDEVKKDLFNSIAHATAIIGLSTSVFLEAGILDRPVALIRTSDSAKDAVFNKSMHFKYLLENHFPEAAANEAECARWLAQVASGFDAGKEARRQFVSRFLRPQGIDIRSAQVAADVILELARKRSSGP